MTDLPNTLRPGDAGYYDNQRAMLARTVNTHVQEILYQIDRIHDTLVTSSHITPHDKDQLWKPILEARQYCLGMIGAEVLHQIETATAILDKYDMSKAVDDE